MTAGADARLVDPHLVDRVREAGEFDGSACMSCGVCTASCPMEIEILPRQLFRHVLLGMTDRLVDDSEAVYSCLLCKQCEQRCPAAVHITDNVRTLRHYLNRTVYGL